jgi:hypothetical protein
MCNVYRDYSVSGGFPREFFLPLIEIRPYILVIQQASFQIYVVWKGTCDMGCPIDGAHDCQEEVGYAVHPVKICLSKPVNGGEGCIVLHPAEELKGLAIQEADAGLGLSSTHQGALKRNENILM